MAQEKEIKILLNIPFDDFIKKIKEKGFEEKKEINQLDIYFDTTKWDLYENIAALRLRLVEGIDHSFTFKKVFYVPTKANKYYVEEIEIPAPFNNPKQLSELFKRLELPTSKLDFSNSQEIENYLTQMGYSGEQRMKKTRKIFLNNDNEFVVDNVDDVGIIVELECLNDEPLDIIEKVLIPSEWSRSHEGTSYMWLKNKKGFDSHIANFKRFISEPAWNVLEHEKEWYLALSN